MSQVPAGWFNDPYGRFHQRYWDGAHWTEHVATDGRPMVDPMGTSPVIPFATPASTTDLAAAEAVASATVDLADGAREPGRIGMLDRIGETSRERSRPSLRAAVAGLGGAVVAIGVLIAVTGDDPIRGEFIAASLIVLVVAVVLRLFVRLAEFQSAAIGLGVLGIVTFGAAVSVSDGSAEFLTGFLVAALFLAAWLLPGFRGVNLYLAMGLLALLAAFGSLSSPSSGPLESSELLPNPVTDTLGDEGVVYLIGAALFLGLTWVLDRRGYRGTATALAATGLIAALVGTVLLVSTFGDTSGPIFVTFVGALVCLVGSHGERRATTWAGAALLAAGVVAFLAVQMEPSSTTDAATVAIVSGLALVLLPLLGTSIRRSMAERSSEGEPTGQP